jgi:hypothetical protein
VLTYLPVSSLTDLVATAGEIWENVARYK